MKTQWFSIIVGLSVLLAAGARADTLKLKNGTAVEGDIVAETESHYTVEISRAGGSIKTKDNVAKADVAEVIRATAEQKAERAMRDAYELTRRYQLDPNNSYPKDYYDKILEGSFRKFLTDYPLSPFDKEMRERIAAWEAERDKVVAGQLKRGGQWVDAEQLAAAEGAKLFQQAQSAMIGARYGEAAMSLEKLLGGMVSSNMVGTAQDMRQKAYQQWLVLLRQQQPALEQQLAACTAKIAAAKARLDKAHDAMRDAADKVGGFHSTTSTGKGKKGGGVVRMGQLSNAVDGPMKEVAAAEKLLADLERQQLQLKEQLALIRRSSAQIQARMAELSIQLPVETLVAKVETAVVTNVEEAPPTPTPPPPPPPPPPAPESSDRIVTSIIRMVKTYWLFGVVGLLVVVWIVSRKLGE